MALAIIRLGAASFGDVAGHAAQFDPPGVGIGTHMRDHFGPHRAPVAAGMFDLIDKIIIHAYGPGAQGFDPQPDFLQQLLPLRFNQ